MQKVVKCDGKYALKISFNLLHKQKSWNFGVGLETNMAKSSFQMRASSFWPNDLKPSLYSASFPEDLIIVKIFKIDVFISAERGKQGGFHGISFN